VARELLAGSATRPPTRSPSQRASMPAGWGRDDRIVLCGEFDGVVVGVAPARCSNRREARSARVLGCYVEPDARCVGVGSALLEGLMAFFTEHAAAT